MREISILGARQFCAALMLPLLFAAFGALTACSGGGSVDDTTPMAPTSAFAVLESSVVEGVLWQLNRPITVTFSEDVDFTTVSSSTIQLVDSQGRAAVGSYGLVDSRTVRFQPTCPTSDEADDGGLGQGRNYRLVVPTIQSPGGPSVTVMSTAGAPLESGLARSFRTPQSDDPGELFIDLAPGAPALRVRGLGAEPLDSVASSYVEFGLDPDAREYFAFDTMLQQGSIPSLVPLNLYSRPGDQFAVMLAFNQAIDVSQENVSVEKIQLQYLSPATGAWDRVPASIELVENCSESGASVRLTPLGIVPQGATMRVAIRAGFRDLTGDPSGADQLTGAVFSSTVANPTGQAGERDEGSDEILELFNTGAGVATSLEDPTVVSALPRADWDNASSPGAVTASFNFAGTGGTGATFDVVVRTGETILIDTDNDVIRGGPGGTTTATQAIIGGVLDLRNLTIEPGGRLAFIGPNTATILATGDVVIEGDLSLNGGDNFGVGTLNTTNFPEQGASGQAGGGSGGTGSFLTSASTPMGGTGFGAFEVPGLGGGGGETSYASSQGTCAREMRRGAGGGGGRLGPDVRYRTNPANPNLAICQMLIGMDAEPGFQGSLDGTGAVSQVAPAAGGVVAPGPFADADPLNNFYGSLVGADGVQRVGELPTVWAGSGGGGGGDAARGTTFPRTPFNPAGDEKGAGGGGGGGGLLVLAIGNIEIRGSGTLTADGGHGGGGENVVYRDRLGGGSGGGSGGHIVLSSAASIIIESTAQGPSVGDFYRDETGSAGARHVPRPIRALGGQGGVGREDLCGAKGSGQSTWRRDAIPFAAWEGRTDIPPFTDLAFGFCSTMPACLTEPAEGEITGGGGDGGPGIIQLHVSDPATQLLYPGLTAAQAGDVTRCLVPPPHGWRSATEPADYMVPFFSTRSASFSRWIPLGLARANEDGSVNPVELFFDGTDAATGEVLRAGSVAAAPAPIVPFTGVGPASGVSIDGETGELRIPAPLLSDVHGLYQRNASLMREFEIQIRDAATPNAVSEFTVGGATFEAGANSFVIAVNPEGARLSDLLLTLAGPEVAVVPFSVRLLTEGVQDAYPESTQVRITFDATVADPLTGAPSANTRESYSGTPVDPGNPGGATLGFASDIGDLTNAPTNQGAGWDFVRFRIEFDLNASGSLALDPQAPRPGIDFLRIPYRF